MAMLVAPTSSQTGHDLVNGSRHETRGDGRSGETPSAKAALRQWVLERGILYALIQTPILAIIGGTPFVSLVPYPFAALPIFAAFILLPMWISYRKRVSTNPDEPVHHLHRYALFAL